MRAMLFRHPRTLVLGALTLLVIVPLAVETLTAGINDAGAAVLVALVLCIALLADNLWNLTAFEREQYQRHLELENAFIEAQSKLDLVRRWLHAQDIDIDLDHVAAESLQQHWRVDDAPNA